MHPEEGREAFRESTLSAFARKERFENLINPAVAKDGSLVWLSTNCIPLLDAGGELKGYRGSDTDITVRRQAEEEILRLSVRLGLLNQHMQEAREEESRRIAVWLHDEVGQMLTRARMDAMLLESAGGHSGPDAAAALASLKRTLDDTVVAIRNISAELRPAILDDFGLAAVVEWIVHENEKRLKIPFHLEIRDVPDSLNGDLAVAFYRILRECLTNIARHARAQSVEIRLTGDQDQLQLEVRDDGRGLAPGLAENPSSFGLSQMRERAVALGGRLRIDSVPGEGTTVRVTVPLGPGSGREAAG